MDEPLAFIVGVGGAANTKYVHSNHLYSVAALTSNTGAVVERYRYDAYGRRTVTDAAGVTRASSSYGFQRGFTGYHEDAETGLYYARARMYSAGLGRFIGRDPWKGIAFMPMAGDGYQDGMGLYGAHFSPNGLDPSGKGVITACECTPVPGTIKKTVSGTAVTFYVDVTCTCECLDPPKPSSPCEIVRNGRAVVHTNTRKPDGSSNMEALMDAMMSAPESYAAKFAGKPCTCPGLCDPAPIVPVPVPNPNPNPNPNSDTPWWIILLPWSWLPTPTGGGGGASDPTPSGHRGPPFQVVPN